MSHEMAVELLAGSLWLIAPSARPGDIVTITDGNNVEWKIVAPPFPFPLPPGVRKRSRWDLCTSSGS